MIQSLGLNTEPLRTCVLFVFLVLIVIQNNRILGPLVVK